MSINVVWQVRRTDRRMNGVEYFDYIASPKMTKYDLQGLSHKQRYYQTMLVEVRDWCWQTWGSSCELSFYMSLRGFDSALNDRWCWHTEYDSHKIYLKSDKEANWFKLKWL